MYARLPDGKESLFQWDTKQYLEVSDDVTRVDFCFRVGPETVYGVFAKDGKCYIPNLLIQKAGIVDALIMSTEIGTTTDRRLEIPVVERPIPPGYVATKDGAIISYDDLEDVIGELNFLSTNGGTMAGDIDMDGRRVTGLVDPVDDGDAVRKRYVDTSFLKSVNGHKPDSGGNVALEPKHIGALPTSGGKMTGGIDMADNWLGDLPYPSSYQDAATKGYVDERIVTYQNVSVPASNWGEWTAPLSGGRPYYANIWLDANVTQSCFPQVVFHPNDIATYNFGPACAAYDGYVQIYAETAPTAEITIPTIVCWKT